MRDSLSYTTSNGYVDIEIGEGFLEHLSEMISNTPSEIALITDNNVAAIYSQKCLQSLSSHYKNIHLIVFPEGESHKTRATKEDIENTLFEKGISKNGLIVALGGGVVTDLAGFVAATYCRGIPYLSVPTTLLGMIDASIGGKTGVDLPYGKNLVGAIYHPQKIIMDISLLDSLPVKEFSYGVVEALKHALIANKNYFEFIENNIESILRRNHVSIHQLIVESAHIKCAIVSEDEKEFGKRRLLNFGHTVAHALEQCTHYRLPHGEAVALGMLSEMFYAYESGILSFHLINRTKNLLHRLGLSLKIPYTTHREEFIQSCWKTMSFDKKSFQRKPRFVMIRDIASPLSFSGEYCGMVDEKICMKALHWMCEHEKS